MISWESIRFEKSPEEREADEARQTCRVAAVTYAAGRFRSSGQVREKLLSQGFSLVLIEEVMPGLAQDGYLQDEEMARSIVRERRGRKAESRLGLRKRMQKFGIEEQVISEVMEEASSDEILVQEFLSENCQAKIDEWKINQDNYLNQQQILAALVRKAASRGFDRQTTLACLRYQDPEGYYD